MSITRSVLAAAFAGARCAAAGSAAADEFDGCRDDGGVACDLRVRAKALDRFGLDAAERWSDRREELLRIFFSDGYGRDLPVLEFRRRLEDRRVVVHALDGTGVRVRSAPLSMEQWDSVASTLEAVRAAPAQQAPYQGEVENPDGTLDTMICMHPWTVVVEAVSGGRVERRVRDTCGQDPLTERAFDLAGLSRAQFRQCDTRDAEWDDPVRALADCAYLHGRETEAAQVAKRFWALIEGQAEQAADLFSDDAAFVWPGPEPASTAGDAAGLWAELDRAAQPDLDYARIDGVRPGEVVVTGVVRVERPGAEAARRSDRHTADYEQVWVREADGVWRIRRWTVRPFRVVN